MKTIPRSDAIEQLKTEFARASGFDLVDYFAELFPVAPRLDIRPDHLEQSRKKLLDVIQQGLLDEQLVDLWNISFPNRWCSFIDEDDHHLYIRSRELIAAEQ